MAPENKTMSNECESLHDDLALFSAGLLEPQSVEFSRVLSHIESCSSCQQTFSSYEKIVLDINSLDDGKVPSKADLARNFSSLQNKLKVEPSEPISTSEAPITRTLSSPQQKSRNISKLIWSLGLSAACLAIAALIFPMFRNPENPGISQLPPEKPSTDSSQIAVWTFSKNSSKGSASKPQKTILHFNEVISFEATQEWVFPDGTRICLRPKSKLMLQGPREIHLQSGEAAFHVSQVTDNSQQEGKAPFVVRGNHSTVRVLGTLFTVKVEDGAEFVQVAQGLVAVRGEDEKEIHLKAGEGAIVSSSLTDKKTQPIKTDSPFKARAVAGNPKAFAWLTDEANQKLALSLEILRKTPNRNGGLDLKLQLTITNEGKKSATIVPYHPLSVNYSVDYFWAEPNEKAQPNQKSMFTRIHPNSYAIVSPKGILSPTKPTRAPMELYPQYAYTLEFNLSLPHNIDLKTCGMRAHYMALLSTNHNKNNAQFEDFHWGTVLQSKPLPVIPEKPGKME